MRVVIQMLHNFPRNSGSQLVLLTHYFTAHLNTRYETENKTKATWMDLLSMDRVGGKRFLCALSLKRHTASTE